MNAAFKIEALAETQTQQSVYRDILNAFSYPGTVLEIAHPLDAFSLVLATLVDSCVNLADLDQSLPPELEPLLGCSPAEFEVADFVVCSAATFPVHDRSPRLGDLNHPHLGATLILVCSELESGTSDKDHGLAIGVSGPGVETCNEFHVTGLCTDWLKARTVWVAGFPLGVDIILCAANRIVGIPRTSKLIEKGSGVNSIFDPI